MNQLGLKRKFVWLAAGWTIGALLIAWPGIVGAQTKVAPVVGAAYNVGSALMDNLKQLTGQRASLTLSSGKVFTGSIKEVGQHLVHLEKLQGKEYFDALIRIEDVSAVEIRFRKPQR